MQITASEIRELSGLVRETYLACYMDGDAGGVITVSGAVLAEQIEDAVQMALNLAAVEEAEDLTELTPEEFTRYMSFMASRSHPWHQEAIRYAKGGGLGIVPPTD